MLWILLFFFCVCVFDLNHFDIIVTFYAFLILPYEKRWEKTGNGTQNICDANGKYSRCGKRNQTKITKFRRFKNCTKRFGIFFLHSVCCFVLHLAHFYIIFKYISCQMFKLQLALISSKCIYACIYLSKLTPFIRSSCACPVFTKWAHEIMEKVRTAIDIFITAKAI